MARGPCHSGKIHASLPQHFPSKATGIGLAMTDGRDDAKAEGGAKSRRDRLGEALRANLRTRTTPAPARSRAVRAGVKARARARRGAATSRGNDRRKPDGDGDKP